jgi:ABC-type phosphate transport system ATPase subunit
MPKHIEPRVGYVFQNPRLLPWRTVRENIQLATGTKTDTLDFLLEVVLPQPEGPTRQTNSLFFNVSPRLLMTSLRVLSAVLR